MSAAWPDPAGRDLLALWGERGAARAAFLRRAGPAVELHAAPAADGRFPALSPRHPAASWFERAIRDLWGMEAEGGTDPRPWLDHGAWPIRAPLGAAARQAPRAEWPEFLAAGGEGVHRIPVGPIHAGIVESGHFRFHVQGEMVVRLEARLGYTHKGVLGLMAGKSPRLAARLAARISGDSTVAHALAFAHAAEAATGTAVPPRAAALRRLLLELERLHNHLNDMGSIADAAAFVAIHAEAGLLREAILRAQALCFGHRLLMDRVVPGGLAHDPGPEGLSAVAAALAPLGHGLARLLHLYETHATLQDRTLGTGVIPPALVADFAPGGVVGRASGRAFDARLLEGPFDVPTQPGGDVDARWRQRHAEAARSLDALDALLRGLPGGPVAAPLRGGGGEGLGLCEGFRGECLCFLRLDADGLIDSVFPRDPSWLHWPLLEAAAAGDVVADFALISRSINGSCSGVDL